MISLLRNGRHGLVAVSACMSLMFPTIYGMALEEVGEDAKIGAAGLSFLLPLLCFAVVAWYGWRCAK